MTKLHSEVDQNSPRSLMLNIESVHLSDEQFYQLCHDNPDLRFELSADRELAVMSPTGSKTGNRNSRINQRLANWAEADDTGICFDSSAGFTLPNGAKRSPDAAWVLREVWDALTEEEQEKFAPICPDFVVELRSPDDSLAALQEKMEEYIGNGTQLGWLFNPPKKEVYIYRPGQPMECLQNPSAVSGEAVLSGYVFDPSEIW